MQQRRLSLPAHATSSTSLRGRLLVVLVPFVACLSRQTPPVAAGQAVPSVVGADVAAAAVDGDDLYSWTERCLMTIFEAPLTALTVSVCLAAAAYVAYHRDPFVLFGQGQQQQQSRAGASSRVRAGNSRNRQLVWRRQQANACRKRKRRLSASATVNANASVAASTSSLLSPPSSAASSSSSSSSLPSSTTAAPQTAPSFHFGSSVASLLPPQLSHSPLPSHSSGSEDEDGEEEDDEDEDEVQPATRAVNGSQDRNQHLHQQQEENPRIDLVYPLPLAKHKKKVFNNNGKLRGSSLMHEYSCHPTLNGYTHCACPVPVSVR